MIRIGTRDSPLALWQAEKVQMLLSEIDIRSNLVFIKSKGDLDTNAPLHSLGTVGVFTKALDDALLADEIDIAVHSCKDLPTTEPEGIRYAAYLERASWKDILVVKSQTDFISNEPNVIATGSIRRKAQWLHRYPQHSVVNLRGNVNTRLKKLEDSEWLGAVFAKAGLERLGFENLYHIELDWMIPAPAQGVICVTCKSEDKEIHESLLKINHIESEITSIVERQFLNVLEGGCSAPIGAHAQLVNDQIILKGVLLDISGKRKIYKEKIAELEDWQFLGKSLAEEILQDGGLEIIEELKRANGI